ALATPLGFEPKGLSVAAFDLGLSKYGRAEGARFQGRALDAVAQLPGVIAAGYGSSVPLFINPSNSEGYREGAGQRVADGITAGHYNVSPGYFATMRMRLLSGREFTWHDDLSAPRVAIINEEFALQVLQTRNAVGRRFREGPNGPLFEVVAV